MLVSWLMIMLWLCQGLYRVVFCNPLRLFEGHIRVVSGSFKCQVKIQSGFNEVPVFCQVYFKVKSLSNQEKFMVQLRVILESIFNYSIFLVVLEAERVFSLVSNPISKSI